MKKIEDVTEGDQELMTSEEYEVGSDLSSVDVWANWDRGIRASYVWLSGKEPVYLFHIVSNSHRMPYMAFLSFLYACICNIKNARWRQEISSSLPMNISLPQNTIVTRYKYIGGTFESNLRGILTF